MARYLGAVSLGGFYERGAVLPRPRRPWGTGIRPEGLPPGDIPLMAGSLGDYAIGSTPAREEDRLRWIKLEDGDRTVLICDRNILTGCSWDDLESQGYTAGRPVVIDGETYTCRLLTGGSTYRSDMDPYGYCRYWGMPRDNEWDRFITGEEDIRGLPAPSASDMETRYDTADYNAAKQGGAHNGLWNWFSCASWCLETYSDNPKSRAARGGYAVLVWDSISSSARAVTVGFRPVLEIPSRP